MGLQYRKAKSVSKGTRVNVSASKRGPGVSLSKRVGPLTLNTRGRASLRVAPGLSFRFGKSSGAAGALLGFAVLAAVLIVRIAIVALTLAVMLSWWILKWAAFGTQAFFAWAISHRRSDRVPEIPAAE